MKLVFYLLLFLVITSVLGEVVDNKNSKDILSVPCLEHIRIEIENDIIVLSCEDDDNLWVEITPGSELYVNGELVKLNSSQRQLVGKYYENFMDFIEQAKELGIEGAHIGLEGVKIGLIAVNGLIKIAVSDFDSEKLEEELEEATDDLEDESEELKELADELKNAAEDFKQLHFALKKEIKELNELTWF